MRSKNSIKKDFNVIKTYAKKEIKQTASKSGIGCLTFIIILTIFITLIGIIAYSFYNLNWSYSLYIIIPVGIIAGIITIATIIKIIKKIKQYKTQKEKDVIQKRLKELKKARIALTNINKQQKEDNNKKQ